MEMIFENILKLNDWLLGFLEKGFLQLCCLHLK